MIDEFRPRLRPSVQVRVRADGTAGVWDTRTGRALEVAADEAPLLAGVDGQRTLAGIAEAHAQVHGYVPFTALRDLMLGLSRHGLLDNGASDLEKAGLGAPRRRLERAADLLLLAIPLRNARALCLAGTFVLEALAAWSIVSLLLERSSPGPLPTGYDVLWAWAGAALALTARGFFRAAAASELGQPPMALRLAATFGVLHLAPDGGSLTFLDRGRRAVVHLAALFGCLLTLAATRHHPGLFAGALAVLLGDLVPFEPTSVGKLLSAAAGRVDLRDHARAYLSNRILARATSRHFFAGEGSLIASLLASLAWFTLLIQVLFRPGLVAVLSLLRASLSAQAGGLERALALFGAAALTVAMPVALAGLFWALLRAVLSLRPPRLGAKGRATGAVLQSADLKAIPVLAQLSPTELERLAQAVQELAFEPGELIVRQGDPGDRFFAIRCGQAQVLHEVDSGLSHEVARLGPGDCFGESALMEHAPRSATVRAATKVAAAALSRKDFDAVVASLGGADLTRLLRAAAALHKSPFFARMPADRLSALALRLLPREVRAGAEVVKQGEPGSEFFLVATGSLEVLGEKGERVAELRPGDHFGEIALLRDVPRVATVRAAEDATLLVLGKDSFLKAMACDLSLSAGVESLAAERAGGA